jgi:hypothetical protein
VSPKHFSSKAKEFLREAADNQADWTLLCGDIYEGTREFTMKESKGGLHPDLGTFPIAGILMRMSTGSQSTVVILIEKKDCAVLDSVRHRAAER